MAPLSSSEVHKLKQSPAWPGGSVAQEAGPFHTEVNRDPGARQGVGEDSSLGLNNLATIRFVFFLRQRPLNSN